MNTQTNQDLERIVDLIITRGYSKNITTGIVSYTLQNDQILDAYEQIGRYLNLNEPLNNPQQIDYDKTAILQLKKESCLQVLQDIYEIDLKSCYPSLLLQSKLTSVTLYNLVSTFIRLRSKYAKSDPRNALYKQAINSLVGKFGSNKSYLYQFQNQPLHADIMKLSREAIQQISMSCNCKEQIAIYTDAVYVQSITNLEQVIQQTESRNLQLEVERFTHFYHSPHMNTYIAMKNDQSVKIRGFHGYNKQTCQFDRFHNTELLEQAIRQFFYSNGNVDILQQYVQQMRYYYSQLQQSDNQQKQDTLKELVQEERDFIMNTDRVPNSKEQIDIQEIDIETIIQNYVQKDINRLLGIQFLKSKENSYVENHLIIAKHEKVNNKLQVQYELVDIRTITESKIKKNKTSSLHEVIRTDKVKLFADLDIHLSDDYKQEHFKEDFATMIMEVVGQFGNVQYSVCHYKKDDIISMHVVWQFVVDLGLQLAFFTDLNKQLKHESFVDLNLYYKNKSIRLPFCQKVSDQGVIQDRQLTIHKGKLEDFFITQTKGIPVHQSYIFEGQMISHVKINDVDGISQSIIQQIHTYLQTLGLKANGFNSKQQGLINFVIYQPPENCVVCNRRHNQIVNRERGLYVYYMKTVATLTCSRVNNKQHNIDIIKKHVIQLKEDSIKVQSVITDYVQYDDSIGKKYVTDYNLPLVFDGAYIIQSAMGTGKSTFLKQCIDANTSVLYVSCRKTFSSKVQNEFGLTSYRDIPDLISPKYFKKVVVQVESLERLDILNSYDLVILDEVISICDHASSNHSNIQLIRKLFADVHSSFIICDALLNEPFIQVFKTLLQGRDITVIKNAYKPDQGKSLTINKFSDVMSLKYIANDIIQKHKELTDNQQKKAIVSVFLTSCTSLEYIEQAITDMEPNLKVRSYHGKNWLQEDNKIHQEIKDEHFHDVNKEWVNYDIILYTSTLSVGISFDLDIPIHQFMILQSGISIPSMNNIYQAIARFRKCQNYSIYVKGNLKRPNIGLCNGRQLFLQSYSSISTITDFFLDIAIESYMSTQNNLGFQWLLFALQQNAYNITIKDIEHQQDQLIDQYIQKSEQVNKTIITENDKQYQLLLFVNKYLSPATHEEALYNLIAYQEVISFGVENLLKCGLSALIRANDTTGIPNNKYISIEDLVKEFRRNDPVITKIVEKCFQFDQDYIVPNYKEVYSKRQLYSWFLDSKRIEQLKQQKGKLYPEQVSGFTMVQFSSLNTTVTKIQKYLKTDQPLRTLQLDKEQALSVVRDCKVALQMYDQILYIIGYYKTSKNVRIEGKQVKQLILYSVQV